MLLHHPLIATEEGGIFNAPICDLHEANRSIFVAQGEPSFGAGGHVIDLSGREIDHIRLWPPSQAVALLGLLLTAKQLEGVPLVGDFEINFERVGPGQTEAQLLRVTANLVVVLSKTCSQNDFVQSMECRTAKSEPFGGIRYWSGGREGG